MTRQIPTPNTLQDDTFLKAALHEAVSMGVDDARHTPNLFRNERQIVGELQTRLGWFDYTAAQSSMLMLAYSGAHTARIVTHRE